MQEGFIELSYGHVLSIVIGYCPMDKQCAGFRYDTKKIEYDVCSLEHYKSSNGSSREEL